MLTARIDGSIADAESRLGRGAEQIGEKLHEQVTQAEAELIARANAISDTFVSVNEQIGLSTTEAAATIDEKTRQLNELLSARSTEIAERSKRIAGRWNRIV